ncbi:hypothetical protein [Desulfovibrio sp. TomC]|uniref:hypothetical protein n=1 Tax=Desulfovibrio sp. TomC TaxID=1562888 RepID=UPI0005750433|nr:hypothetical protein [Desulfovibrio sp. TomC]KHK00411.1 hypothetical protein NY78_4160 [Desulfovibrio sp. TomC]
MTGQAGDWQWLEVLAHLGAAMAFLLVGWRLGRESAGRAMFDYRALPPAREAAEEPEEADPWSEAAIGATALARRPRPVDIFETLRPACRGNGGDRDGFA